MGTLNPSSSSTFLGASAIEDYVPDDDDAIAAVLGEKFSMLTVHPNSNRYFGKSSGPMLVQKAIDLKKEYNGDEALNTERLTQVVRPEFRECNPVCASQSMLPLFSHSSLFSGKKKP